MRRGTQSHRPPFFRVGDRYFLDVSWNFGDAQLMPTPEQLAQLLAAVAPDQIVIAREMTSEEVARLLAARVSSDEEVFSFTITKDAARWTAPRTNRSKAR